MIYQILGCLFGLFMGLHYYFLLVLLPAIIDRYLGDDS